MIEIPLAPGSLEAFEAGDRKGLLAAPHPVLLAFARGCPDDIRLVLDREVITGHEGVDREQAWMRDNPPDDLSLLFLGCIRCSKGRLTEVVTYMEHLAYDGDEATFHLFLEELAPAEPQYFIRLALAGRFFSDEKRSRAIHKGVQIFPNDHRLSALSVYRRAREIGEAYKKDPEVWKHRAGEGDPEEFVRAKAALSLDPLDYNHFMWVSSLALSSKRLGEYMVLSLARKRRRRAARSHLLALLEAHAK